LSANKVEIIIKRIEEIKNGKYETVKAKIVLNQWFPENQKNITFSEFFNQYDSYARGRIRSYVRSIYSTIRKWILPYFGKLILSEIDTKIVDSFQSYLISKGLSAASVNKYLAILKACFQKQFIGTCARIAF